MVEIVSKPLADIVSKISNRAVEQIIEKWEKGRKTDISKIVKELPERLELHNIEVLKWAKTIPLLDQMSPTKTSKSTVELLISTTFDQVINGKKRIIDEETILTEQSNTLIIGQPGAGKTTTIKRIILKLFWYHLQKTNKSAFITPILIRLRSLKATSISNEILRILNIDFEVVTETDTVIKINEEGERVEHKVSYSAKYVGDERIEDFIPKVLNRASVILFLDGFDEIEYDAQESILQEIEILGMRLKESKIVLTVRKTKMMGLVSGFNFCEIKPLNSKLISRIVEKWFGSDFEFLNQLKLKPYRDLADRPIFLVFLLICYQRWENLPEKPFDVYRDSTYLIVRDWDESRRIKRKSKYSQFQPAKKIEFLSEISYYLTYKNDGSKEFTSRELRHIYDQICDNYSLPKEEMEDVIDIIESHTGIITKSGFNTFEFAHLSIQEYLCASYLVQLPFSHETIDYFCQYPEPIAIAICLSPKSEVWFANLILNENLKSGILKNQTQRKNQYLKSLYTLLSRLELELPSFKVSKELGFSILYIVFETKYFEWRRVILDFLQIENTLRSLLLAYDEFDMNIKKGSSWYLKRTKDIKSSYFLKIPEEGFISDEIVSLIENSRDNF